MTSLEFVAYGRPAPQGSKQFGATGQLYEQSRYLGEHVKPDGTGGSGWRRAVWLAATRARLAARWRTATKPCVLDVVFAVKRPDRPDPDRPWLADYPAGPPDKDKLERAVADVLTRAGVWADDALWVGTSRSWKVYPDHRLWQAYDRYSGCFATGAHITVTRLSDMEDEAQ